MIIYRPRLAQPGYSRGKYRTASSPKLFMFKEEGMQVSPVTMSRLSWRTAAPLCLPLNINFLNSLKEDVRLSAFGSLDEGGFLDVGGFWKGKELLKENC
jgi:hypothetical protein